MVDSGDTGRASDALSDAGKQPAVVTQQEIDDVLGDERLSAGEREARLTDLRQRILDDEHARDDESHAPLQIQIMDAISMLAQGGHDYIGHARIEGEETVASSQPHDTDSV